MKVPSKLLERVYNFGSLQNGETHVTFSLKNRLADVTLTAFNGLSINGTALDLTQMALISNGQTVMLSDISNENPIVWETGATFEMVLAIAELAKGKHTLSFDLQAGDFGALKFSVSDAIADSVAEIVSLPRDKDDDYADHIIKQRQQFVAEFTGKPLNHITRYSFDPHMVQGNCEHFTGVAQIPMGFAGPLIVDGEHAQGEFLIPMATTEGTLIASYNRGMKLLNLCGGVKCTVSRDAMQRAPVFVFDDARGARDFVQWVNEHFAEIAIQGESTSSVAKLLDIDSYLSNKFAFLRFNFSTGDAAGQNMVGRATFAACSWILDHYEGPPVKRFYLESNFATDKKASMVNVMRTRGKRVTAEATIKRDVLIQNMRVEPETLAYHHGVAGVGSFLSGANNNGLHSANGITAMFIATGQDVANVSESSAGIFYAELTPERDLYISITIPSLIVATYGGGTGLATQRESLELLDCYGKGKVHKFAEIVAGVVLAGEISLASAISALDWVSSHEQYGRNR